MEEVIEEYGGIFIAFLGAVLVLTIIVGLIQENGLLGKVILWFGNNAC